MGKVMQQKLARETSLKVKPTFGKEEGKKLEFLSTLERFFWTLKSMEDEEVSKLIGDLQHHIIGCAMPAVGGEV